MGAPASESPQSSPPPDRAGGGDLRAMGASARMDALHEAVRALGDGAIVLAPGDTGCLGLAGPNGPSALELARRARSDADGLGACVWLAPELDLVAELMPLSRIGRKLLRMLTPGAAIFRVRLDEQTLASARAALGFEPGVVDDGERLLVRIAGASVAATLAARAHVRLASWEPLDGHGRPMTDAGEAAQRLATVGLAGARVLIDAPASGAGKAPTVIDLERGGGVRVQREGAYQSRYVLKHAVLNVLMVCTGNTCRSPMAEAIAAGLAGRDGEGGGPLAVSVSSAGIGAGGGSARAAEGNEAVERLGFRPSPGVSRALTRGMIAEADEIYGMTRSHVAGVLAIDPSAAGKVHLLDPRGEEVPDPIGMPREAYYSAAERLRGMIEQRLKEWRT